MAAKSENPMKLTKIIANISIFACLAGAGATAQTREVAGLYQCLGGRCAEKAVATPTIRSYGDSLECSNERAEGFSRGYFVSSRGTVIIHCFGQSGKLSPNGMLQWEDGIVWKRIPCTAPDPRSWADKMSAPRPGCGGA